MLSHLDKSASRNIIFLFTNARSTFFAPGDSAPALREILKAVREQPPYVGIKFNRENTFCFDNESFRFLVAVSKQNSITFSEQMKREFETSWRNSVAECGRLMEYIAQLQPHIVQDTVSVNNARNSILLLTQPLGDISKNVADNVEACKAQERKVFEWQGDIKNLEKELYMPSVDIISTPLNKPITVCGDPGCCEKKNVNGSVKTHYKTVCHRPCYLHCSDGNVIGNTGLLECQAFNKYQYVGEARWYKPGMTTWYPDYALTPNEKGEVWGQPATRVKSDICFVCKHSYQVHLHINYETRIQNTQIRDDTKYQRITNAQDAAAAQQKTIASLKARIDQLHYEQNEITKYTAKFACFLRTNALTPFNDAFEDYLKYLINNEEGIPVGDDSGTALDNLKKMLSDYKHQKTILESAMKSDVSSTEDMSSKSVEQWISHLCNMKIYGSAIKKHLDMQKKLQELAHKHHKEVRCHVKSAKTSLWKQFTNYFS